ncbi:MAG: hypothetical protein PHP97_00820 [Candidatus Shapirobacteria bacterium]|nr:hypothetical protein [Candidatus Shapirobacteria bacterium]MDD3002745.1 hypothetical protein [Candidatus Shapirobacteria bacterium]MDD4383471.1 hypothetical protein [Candidatus Shapirobacteria bacterium]
MHLITILVLLPVILNLSLYLSWSVFGLNFFSSLTAFIITLFIIIFYFQKNFTQLKNNLIKKNYILPLLLIIGNIILVAAVLSPYIQLIKVDNFVSLATSSVTDLYKHSYVVTSLKTFGLPLHHPYFPPASFSYYYGYYLTPALFSYFLPQFQNYFLFFYILFTDFISLLILFFIITKFIKNNFLRFLSLCLVIFGMGLDVFPMFLDGRLSHPDLIEMWSISNHLGLRIDNTFVSLLWTPQHFFAAAVSSFFIYKIITSKNPTWLLISLFSFVFLSSAFVALSLALITFLIFIVFHEKRKSIFRVGLFSIVLLLPYFLSVIQKGGGIFKFYHFQPYSFVDQNQILNYFLTLISEYGFLFLLLPFLIPLFIKKIKPTRTTALFLAIYLPVIITCFICSTGYNDFALRSTILPQLLVIIFFIKAVEIISNRFIKYFLIAIILLNLIISFSGFLFEYASRWKSRQVIDPYASELILKLRSIKDSIIFSTIGQNEWIFQIPPLAFKPIYTSDLYDSGGYLQDNPSNTFGEHETKEKEIYTKANIGSSLKEIISERNFYLLNLNKFTQTYQFDWLILDHRIGVKKGLNFWVPLFEKINVKSWSLTPTFIAFNHQSLISQLADKSIFINQSKQQTFKIIDNKVTLPSGFWYLSLCNQKTSESILHFESEDAYPVFSSPVKSGFCIGNFFYLENKSLLKLLNNSSQEIYIFPVELSVQQSKQN